MKLTFQVKSTDFHITFFGKSGQGGLIMEDLCNLSHKLILNEIPWFVSGIWSTVALAWLTRRNTMANAEQSK